MIKLPIVSYIEDSFQEYEGEQSFVLFTRGCNMDCCGCYNRSVVCGEAKYEFEALMNEKITPMHTAVVFLGGEPTIHDDLFRAVMFVKSRGLKTKIYTNGFLFDRIYSLVDEVDSFSVDFKCLEKTEEYLNVPAIDYFKNFVKTILTLKERNKNFEIRTTKFPWITNQLWMMELWIDMLGVRDRWILQEPFRLEAL